MICMGWKMWSIENFLIGVEIVMKNIRSGIKIDWKVEFERKKKNLEKFCLAIL
jgi:hypothetical protein